MSNKSNPSWDNWKELEEASSSRSPRPQPKTFLKIVGDTYSDLRRTHPNRPYPLGPTTKTKLTFNKEQLQWHMLKFDWIMNTSQRMNHKITYFKIGSAQTYKHVVVFIVLCTMLQGPEQWGKLEGKYTGNKDYFCTQTVLDRCWLWILRSFRIVYTSAATWAAPEAGIGLWISGASPPVLENTMKRWKLVPRNALNMATPNLSFPMVI